MANNRYDVGYGTLDAFKRLAQAEALSTDHNIERFGLKPVAWTRGESVDLVEAADRYDAHVNEGLGTKNIAADLFATQCELADMVGCEKNRSYYDQIARCAAAMIFNDMITLGALPTTVAMHLAVASADWFKWEDRYKDLLKGWRQACDIARCRWGPGETPALRDLVIPGKAIISGSASGIIQPKSRLIKRDIRAGDAIILLESSGIHANGLTFARDLATKLAEGYLTRLPSGRMYGEALLDPTHIYVRYIEDLLDNGIDVHYSVNITGHGWRKLMRAPEKFSYFLSNVPRPPEIFGFLQRHGGVSLQNMYADFNMGAGFAIYVNEKHARDAMMLLRTGNYPFGGLIAGKVLSAERSEVIIAAVGVRFVEDELQVR